MQSYQRYIERFNAADQGAFVDSLAEDVLMQNGGMQMKGRAAVIEHYERNIWPFFRETVHALRVVADPRTLAVEMWTHFEATTSAETVFGPVRPGDTFDYRGVVLYDVREDGRFSRVLVSYLSFEATPVGGVTRKLPIPH